MKEPKYVRSPEAMSKVVALAQSADVDAGVAEQTYRSTFVREENLKEPFNLPPGVKIERQTKAAIDLFDRDSSMPYTPEQFRFDDISSLGHLNLETIREERAYNRAAVYELPLLAQYREKYVPRAPHQYLRFTYATAPSETEIAVPEVVLQFDPTKVPDLSAMQLHKLCLLAAEYMADGLVTFRCSSFATQAQNKRYLLDQLRRLLACAKDGDTFTDVPLPAGCAKRERRRPLYPRQAWPQSWNRDDLRPRAENDIFSQVHVATL